MTFAGHVEALRQVLLAAGLEGGVPYGPICEGDTLALIRLVPVVGDPLKRNTGRVYAVGPVAGDFTIFRRWFDDLAAELWRLNLGLKVEDRSPRGEPVHWHLVTDRRDLDSQARRATARAALGIKHQRFLEKLEDLPAWHPLRHKALLAEVDQITVCGHPVRHADQLARVRDAGSPEEK